MRSLQMQQGLEGRIQGLTNLHQTELEEARAGTKQAMAQLDEAVALNRSQEMDMKRLVEEVSSSQDMISQLRVQADSLRTAEAERDETLRALSAARKRLDMLEAEEGRIEELETQVFSPSRTAL